MPSFEIFYDEDEDFLEVTFASYDENFSRSLVLNDNLVLHTDLSLGAAWGLTFYSYRVLLQVSETHLDGLRLVEARDAHRLLSVLAAPPVNFFLKILDPTDFRALVLSPALAALL